MLTLQVEKTPLLNPDEPPAFTVLRSQGSSDFVLSCDHASRRIPQQLSTLGLSEIELSSHIAWDIGAAAVTRMLSERLDAAAILQTYSRLVIDCNRPLAAPDSIPTSSEWVQIGGNQQVDADQAAARRAAIFQPYHDEFARLLDRRQRDGRPGLLVAVHSFTPVYRGVARPWHIGLMYRRDARIAVPLLELLRRDERLVVGDNEPYPIEDEADYSLPVHGEARGIAHVGIEIRQDLIADESGQKTWAGRLASMLKQVRDMTAGV